MTLFAANGKIVFFAHIPKTGGTSVVVTLREAGARRAMHNAKRFGLRCPPQHMHSALFHEFVPKSFYDAAMTVVRNPFVRIASEYDYRMDLEKTSMPFNEWVAGALEGFKHNNFIYDNHIRPQVEFRTPKMKVFRFEDGLGNAIQYVCKQLSLTAPEVSHHKRGQGRTISASEETIKAIREFYKIDFEAFGYDTEQVPDRLRGEAIKLT